MKTNEYKYLLFQALYSITLLMITGSVLQGFLLETGMGQDAVAQLLAIFQAVQVGMILLFSLVIDRIKRVLPLYACSILGQILLLLALIALCLFPGIDRSVQYALVLGVGAFTNLLQAISNVLGYKVPYLIINMRDFGPITGISGMINGILGIAVSTAMTLLTARFNYKAVMLGSFLFAAVLLIIAIIAFLQLKPLAQEKQIKRTAQKRINMLTYPPFTVLLLPNLLRGFCIGILGVAMTVGHTLGITNRGSGAMLTLLLQIANIISCFLYARIAKPQNDGRIILIATLALAVSLPAMLIGNALPVFYLFFLIANFSISFINNAVPVAVTKFIDFEYVGQYSSWRMLIHTLGVTIGNAVAIPMVRQLGGISTFALAAAAQLLSGLAYYFFLKQHFAKQNESA